MLYQFKPSKDVPQYVADGLQNYYQSKIRLDENVRKAQLLQAFEQGQLEKGDLEHFAFKDLGFGVLQDEEGCIWWVEENKVLRQEDSYMSAAVEAYKEMASKSKKTAQLQAGMQVQIKRPVVGLINMSGKVIEPVEIAGSTLYKIQLDDPISYDRFVDFYTQKGQPQNQIDEFWRRFASKGYIQGDQISFMDFGAQELVAG